MTRLLALVLALPSILAAQSERQAYAEWIAGAANSPAAAIAHQPIGEGLTLGPADADIPLDGIGEHRIGQRGGAVTLHGPEGSRQLPRNRPVPLGDYTLSVAGPAGRGVVTVFADGERKPPSYYPQNDALVFVGELAPPDEPARVRILALDGVETEAVEAGTVTVPIAGTRARLRVRRVPTGPEEAELEIYFRDATNGNGTYPAGRFVTLVPDPDGGYRLDFNRARNPFCAYSTAYPCPAPWRGNTIDAPVDAGEQYLGGGLDVPEAQEEQ